MIDSFDNKNNCTKLQSFDWLEDLLCLFKSNFSMHFRACHNAYVSMPFLYLPCLFLGEKLSIGDQGFFWTMVGLKEAMKAWLVHDKIG